MCCSICCHGAIYHVLAVLGISVALIISIVLYALIREGKLYEGNSKVARSCLISIVVCAAVLVLSLLISCCGSPCFRSVLGTVYLCFGAGLIGSAVLLMTRQNWMLKEIDNMWDKDDFKYLKNKIESHFDCHGYPEN